jgi:Acyltransferase
MPRHLRRKMGVPLLHFQGLEHLRDSLSKKAGILLASNHVRWADPIVVGAMGLQVQQYLYYVVSYHLFKQKRLIGWWLNRIGGYSILREGADREAIRATVGILTKAERPILMFPEGTWFRQNDRVGPLQEGLGLIIRQAAKQCERPILVHPVGIKYWLLGDPRPELNRRVEKLERGLGWLPKHGSDLPERLAQVGNAMLAVKEIERFGRAQEGELDERIRRLAGVLIGDMEKRYLGKEYDGWNLERIRRLRLVLVRKLTEARDDADASRVTREALEVLFFCENLSAHSQEYLTERPSLERIAETIQRIEETTADRMEEPIGELGATLAVGPAVDVRAFAGAKRAARGAGDPLMEAVADGMKSLLHQMLEQGPPPEWNCLPPVGRQSLFRKPLSPVLRGEGLG